MKKILILSILLVLISSCWWQNKHHWKEFSAKGIPVKDEGYNNIVFVSDSMGYLGGDRTVMLGKIGNGYKFTKNAVLYKTINQGKVWSEIPLNYKGSVDRIFSFGDTLVLLIQYVTCDTNYIIKSINGGKSWVKIFSSLKKNWIREIYFTNSISGKIIVDSRNENLLSYNGNKWDTLLNLPENYYFHKIFSDKLVSLIPCPNSKDYQGLLITDLASKKTKQILFDKSYDVASLVKNKDDLYLAVSNGNKEGLLRLTERGLEVISLGIYSNYELNEIFAYQNLIVIIAYRQEDVGFLGVIHNILISHDAGKTWTIEKSPSSMYLTPAVLYKDKFFMTYCGAGLFQITQ